jgi:homoserine kinase type II
VPQLLAPWIGRPLPLQPCLCDIWHEHVLYEGDRVTGLIDFGGVKIDHVAADLARLLGSLAEDDPAGWAAGLEAYAGVRPLAPEEEALARVLDRTGVIVGVMTWLRWLYEEGRSFEDRGAAAGRLAALVRRMERW